MDKYDVKVLCQDPYLFVIDDFLTDEECEFIKNVSKDGLKSAGVSFLAKDKGKYGPNSKYKGRTNQSNWIKKERYPEMLKISQKIGDLMNCDYRYFEDFQVIHYNESEEYKYHYDAYDKRDKEKYNRFCSERGNRIGTVLVYLNDVEEGGETGFDSIDKSTEPLLVEAKKGRLVLFKNINPDGSLNMKSRHAGLPIKKGEKWAFNLWLRERF
jgi:prolyl 4-hydroxylase